MQQKGMAEAPIDGRQVVDARPRQKIDCARLNVDNFLHWAYGAIAEYLPEAPDKGGDVVNHDFPDLPTDFNGSALVDKMGGVDDEVAREDVRYLPPMTAASFFQLYQDKNGTASRICFDLVFKSTQKLQIRRGSQHGQCNDCVRLKLQRKQASTPQEITEVNKEYKGHLDAMFLDRVIDSRIAAMSFEATRSEPAVIPEHDVGSIALDAMDQSKFRIPR